MASAFPGLGIDEDSLEEEDTEIPIFLFSDKELVYRVFLVARFYLTENLGLDSAICLRLLDKYELDIEEGLRDLYYIHSGYISVLTEDLKDGRESDKD